MDSKINRIKNLINLVTKYRDHIKVTLLAYTHEEKEKLNTYSLETEYFTLEELEQLIESCQSHDLYVETYNDQNDFFKDVCSGEYFKTQKKYNIVYDTTQKGLGIGKDALIPAFCDIYGILYTGTNAYVNSLVSNKYDWTKLLESENISVPKTKKINLNSDDSEYEFLDNWIGPKIVKPNYSYASLGIDKESKTFEKKNILKKVNEIETKLNQPSIIQEFIPGYEVEIGIIGGKKDILILPIIGISIEDYKELDTNFLDFRKVATDNYSFYDFQAIAPDSILKKIFEACEAIAKLIDTRGHLRIDMRISKDFKNCYVFDINAYPHIIDHSSISQAFKILNLPSHSVLLALIGNTIERNN